MARRRNNPPGSPSPPASPPPPAPPASSWKDHPLAVAAVSVSATLVIGGGLVKDLIIPAYTEALKNQLIDFPRVKKENEDLHHKVEELQGQLATSRSETASALTANVFVRGDPYPNGLNSVRLGDSISKVEKIYSISSIEKPKRGGYWSVKTNHPVFHTIVYYFDASATNPKVRGVLIFVNDDKYASPYLKNKLTSLLGEPTGIDDDEHLYWTEKGYWVKLDKASYSIDMYGPSLTLKKSASK